MVAPSRTAPSRLRLRLRLRRRPAPAFAARSRERGATLFVVVLVVTLLMGIGAFAARSAHLATAASGSERQMTQARYIAEYGLMFAIAKLSNTGAQSYLAPMKNPPATELCTGQTTAMTDRSCYLMMASELQTGNPVDSLSGGGFTICDKSSGGIPGSLGMANVECDFVVELSDLSPGFTPPGYNVGPGQALQFKYVTATATGQVRIINTGGTGALDTTSAESSGTQTVRTRLIAGPLPAN